MKKYRYSISQENILSFMPSLFPYIEWNNEGECELHYATDGHNGSYSHIVPNMRINDGRIMSYKELMKLYKENTDATVNSYVSKAIGKIIIDKTIFDDNLTLLPDYVYLSNVSYLYNEYLSIKKLCEESHIDDKSLLCCLQEKYRNMGGDTFLNLLGDLKIKANEIAKEYYGYAVMNNTDSLKLKFNILLSQSIDDIGYIDSPIEEWIPGKEYHKGDCVIYNNDIYRCKTVSKGKYDDDSEMIEFDIKSWELASIGNKSQREIQGTTDSKLKSLRRYTEYLNANDETETPSFGEDWLFFYRKGYVANYRTLNDDYGNIVHNGTNYENGDDLMAYGDVLTDITYDRDKHLIRFKYVLDAHLKATYQKSEIDDDGNVKYLFSDFKYDDGDKIHGVIYTDTYSYSEGGDIDKLIEGGGFENYISDGQIDVDGLNIFTKLEFNTQYASMTYVSNSSDIVIPITSIMSTFESTYEDDVVLVPTVRRDYLNGISYVPSKDIDVRIDRGNTSALEKHIKFSEVKTLEDMELFTNGGFFIMKEDS